MHKKKEALSGFPDVGRFLRGNAWIGWGVIVALFLFTRFFRLDSIPAGLHVDEVGMAYDAYSLANFGTDRYLNPFPVYLINYGDGQSALYAYLAALCIKVFGATTFAIRLPAVLSGGLVLIFGTLLIKEASGKKDALLYAFLVTVCPYFIMASRFGLDCNLFLGFFTMSLYWLWRAAKKGRLIGFLGAGLSFGVTLYTYSLSWLTLPLFLGLTFLFMLRCGKIRFREAFVFALPLGILAIPLLLFLVINMGRLGEIRTGLFTIPKLFAFRGGEFSLSNIKNGWQMLRSVLTYGPLSYNAFPRFGTLYYVSLPFIAIGFVLAFRQAWHEWREKRWSLNMLTVLMFVSVLGCGLLTADTRVINKSNAVFFSLVYFLAFGLRVVIRKWRSLAFGTVVVYSCLLVLFVQFYFFSYEQQIYPQEYFDDHMSKLVAYLEETCPERTKYIDTTGMMQGDMYILWETKTSPEVFMREAETGQPRNYDGYCTFYPDEVDIDGIYVVKTKEEVIPVLEEKGFTMKEYEGYRIYGKEE